MLFSAPVRRLILLAVIASTLAFLFLTQSKYNATSLKQYLPELHRPDKQSHDELVPDKTQHESNDRVEEPIQSQYSSPFATSPGESDEKSDWPAKPPVPEPEDKAYVDLKPPDSPEAPADNVTEARPEFIPQPKEGYEKVQAKILDLIRSWSPPHIDGHKPPYDVYADKDYDPNRWEAFNWASDYYIRTGIGEVKAKLEPYLPYPKYNTPEWSKQWRGTYKPCMGPRDKPLNVSDQDWIKSYGVLPKAFPEPAIGDTNVTGTSLNRCTDRYHRYGAYGFGQGERDPPDDWESPLIKPDWTSVHWKRLQDQCFTANKDRFIPEARQLADLKLTKELPSTSQHPLPSQQMRTPSYHYRTAVLYRVWESYRYTEDDMQDIRALITELSLLSGGEVQVFLLVDVKDDNMEIFGNTQHYNDVLNGVPKEFRNITILWNKDLLQTWYPMIESYGAFWHPYMPLQWFSINNPEYDFIWNWEADVRYTGNYYEFMSGVSKFAADTPRKYLWERNQKFYVPKVHGSWQQFTNATHAEIEDAMEHEGFKPVWEKRPFDAKLQDPVGPDPPHDMKKDKFQWGVGEDADLVTLQPIWDPREVDWAFKDKIWNFIPNIRPVFTDDDPMASNFRHPRFKGIERRTSISSHVRLSRRQLYAMHTENLAGRTMAGEMWPATVALHHGLKAVYAPHAIWTDREWPAWYLEAVLNAAKGEKAQWAQRSDSVWIHDRSHNLVGTTWFVEAEFPKTLYRRWLGLRRIDASPLAEIGGKDWETYGRVVDLVVGENGEEAEVQVGGHGRMCLPPMLLHPVKDVYEEAMISGPVLFAEQQHSGKQYVELSDTRT